MIVLIDNYDSFSWNLAHALGVLEEEPVVYRNDALTVTEAIALNPQAIVLSSGPGQPRDAGHTLAMASHFAGQIPLLGIGLGCLAIGAALGARVARAASIMHGVAAPVRHNGQGLYTGLQNPFNAGHYHALTLERDSLPSGLEVEAESPDGVILGLRQSGQPTFGLQFHPESILTPCGKMILRNFLNICHIHWQNRAAKSAAS